MPAPTIMLAILLGLGFLGLLLAAGRKGKPYHDHGSTFTLKHSPLLRWFSIIAVFGGNTVFALGMVLRPPKDPMMTWVITTGIALLGLFGMALLWESFRWSLTVSPTTLKCHSPWKPDKSANWADVVKVNYSRVNHWYVIRFSDGASFRVPSVVPGVTRFAEVCKVTIPERIS